MPQRQFRSDDTSNWIERYGRGLDGVYTVSANTVYTPAMTTCTGTSGDQFVTASPSGFTVGRIVGIIQLTGTGATASDNFELNVISSLSTTINLKYPLTKNYVSGALIFQFLEVTALTVASGFSLAPEPWNGTAFGILPILCSGVTNLNGFLDMRSCGWVGGFGSKQAFGNHAYAGESYTGAGGTVSSGQLAANGGGSGNAATFGSGSGSGSGASYGTAGTGSKAGATYGNVDLKNFLLGSGGAGGFENGGGTQGGRGGRGSGSLMLFTRELICAATGGIKLDGANGETSSTYGGGGASGGAALIKCQKATGLQYVSALGGAVGATDLNGGPGGKGRIHVDYAYSVAGVSDPVADTRKDIILGDGGALFGSQY